jgi:hypothetical protein
VEAIVRDHAVRQHSDDRRGLPHAVHRYRWIPDAAGTIQYLVPPRSWRAYINGVNLVVTGPRLHKPARIVATYLDPDIARRIWGYANDPTKKQGSLILQQVNGHWYTIIRYRRKGGRKRKPSERGWTTREEWPGAAK